MQTDQIASDGGSTSSIPELGMIGAHKMVCFIVTAFSGMLLTASNSQVFGHTFTFNVPSGWKNLTVTRGTNAQAFLMFVPPAERRVHGAFVPPTGAVITAIDMGTNQDVATIIDREQHKAGLSSKYSKETLTAGSATRNMRKLEWIEEMDLRFHYRHINAYVTVDDHVLLIAMQYRLESLYAKRFVTDFEQILHSVAKV